MTKVTARSCRTFYNAASELGELILFEWIVTGLSAMLATIAGLWSWRQYARKHQAAQIVRAIENEDQAELRLLLAEGADFRLVSDWFGEPALILVVESGASVDGLFVREAVKLLIERGADIDEPGIEWKSPLMHAAANGDQNLCTFLLSHGANASGHDMFGRTASDWARAGGHHPLASFLRKQEPSGNARALYRC